MRWTERAKSDLQGIYDYIALDSAFYAHRFVKKLVEATRKLESIPLCGKTLAELPNLDLREVTYSGYRLIYRVRGKNAEILAVVDGRRDVARLAKEEWELE